MDVPPRDYARARLNELENAARDNDPDTAVTVVQRMRGDGYTEFADDLCDHLDRAGLGHLTRRMRG
jgi:hypothetical protein